MLVFFVVRLVMVRLWVLRLELGKGSQVVGSAHMQGVIWA